MFFILFIIRPNSCAAHLIPISPPDLRQQKRKRLESQNHSPSSAPYGGTHHTHVLLFPLNLKTRLHVADRFKFFHQPGGHYRRWQTAAIKAVMRLHDCSPSVFTVSNPLFSSYDRNVFCCQRDPFLDVQGPPSEPAL